MKLLDTTLQDYIEKLSDKEPALLAALNTETHAQVPGAHMLSGHFQGRVLALFSRMIQPKKILEIGTYTGYSALCLAEGLQPGGTLHTIDNNAATTAVAQRYFSKARRKNQIKLHVGVALEIIPQLNETFDLVFIDADKTNYTNYYDSVWDKVRPGGLIMADNVLWGGKVLIEKPEKMDKHTQAIMHFTQKVHSDIRVENVLLPIRDGLMVVRKK